MSAAQDEGGDIFKFFNRKKPATFSYGGQTRVYKHKIK